MHDIDAHYLKKKLQEVVLPEEILELENKILNIIGNGSLTIRECEKKLITLLTPKRIDLIKTLVKQRYTIFYGILHKQA